MSPDDSTPVSNIACVILAGGRSRRFGSNKAFAQLGGTRLIDQLIHRLAAQTSGPIAINAPENNGYERDGHVLISDRIQGDIGPLAGLHAALSWAEEERLEAVITTPVDTPILPDDLVEHLSRSGVPSICRYDDRTHHLHGIWPATMRIELEERIVSGMRAVHQWIAACNANACVFPARSGADPFFNINTQEDLEIFLKF